MFTPENEQGLIVVFSMQAQQMGWEFVRVGTGFPDAVVRYGGQEWRTEFEYSASNFLAHRHDHRECDLIVCWENDYADCPLPVIALQGEGWRGCEIDRANPDKVEIEYWKQRALRSERQMSIAHADISIDDDEDPRILVAQLRAEGLTNSQIGDRVGVHRNTISKWLNGAAKVAT